MLYPLWLETLRHHRERIAIFSERGTTTFAQLAEALAASPRATAPIIARSGSLDFFVSILQAWRDDQPLIPIEQAAPAPVISGIPDRTALVKYTPGAAGVPRGIFFEAATVANDAARLVQAMDLTATRPNLAAISLAHSYGFSNIVLPMLLHGVPIHLVDAPFPQFVKRALELHDSMVIAAVPSMWRAWLRSGILKSPALHLAISAGAPLALQLEHDAFDATGLKLHNFYGASECGGISFDATATPRSCADDVGTPLPGVQVSVSDCGRLLVASDAIATGYEMQRADDLLDGRNYLTRDLGHLDSAGRVHLTGNTGQAINVAGRKISPAKVEAGLMATGLLKSVKVYGIPSRDPERVEELAAHIELLEGASLDQLKHAAHEKLANWEVPRHWE